MRFKEADIQEERLLGLVAQKSDRAGRDIARGVSRRGEHPVVADLARVFGDVLDSGQNRRIARGGQRMDKMLAHVGHAKTAVRQPQHAAVMGALPGEQRRARRGTGRRGAKGAAHQHASVGEPL